MDESAALGADLLAGIDPRSSLLLTDLYQFSMIEAYLASGQTDTAVFEFFVRKLPERRGFLIAAGLAQALDWLENLRAQPAELDWLKRSGRFSRRLIDYLANLRFEGEVDAIAEGTVVFGNEPLLRVVAPLPVAQLVETRLINILHYQTLIAAKAARLALAAPGKLLVDFGLRRAHGADAGLMAARAAYIAGFAGTATVLAEPVFGIPIYGTMAHSFIQVHDDETQAFEAFAHAHRRNITLLIDTYDTAAAAHRVVALVPRLAAAGIGVTGVRIDSGDLLALSRQVREILDRGGLGHVGIFASGGLDEDNILAMERAQAPIAGYGIGTSLTTSSDAAALDCAYKLQEYAGLARRKRSTGKATWPGRKQVWRRKGADGRFERDLIAREGELLDPAWREAEPLMAPVMRKGRRLAPDPGLAAIRERAAAQLGSLPEPLRRLEPDALYPVAVSPGLEALAAEVDRRLGIGKGG
ncbi:MAG: nicotinate phosphoribosyltransferase [Pseudomonadota bacterium]